MFLGIVRLVAFAFVCAFFLYWNSYAGGCRGAKFVGEFVAGGAGVAREYIEGEEHKNSPVRLPFVCHHVGSVAKYAGLKRGPEVVR